MRDILTTEDFISHARLTHGDKYIYKKSKFVALRKKIEIECRHHSSFFQNPREHIKGQGCPSCSGNKRMTTGYFIKKSSEKHNNRYTYSKSVYTNNSSELTITCPVHGDFSQIASVHMRGRGCPSCNKHKKMNTADFIEKATLRHGDRYVYDKVSYVNSVTNVLIGCRIHGYFSQRPSVHLEKKGCPECAPTAKIDTEIFKKEPLPSTETHTIINMWYSSITKPMSI